MLHNLNHFVDILANIHTTLHDLYQAWELWAKKGGGRTFGGGRTIERVRYTYNYLRNWHEIEKVLSLLVI